VEKSYRKIGIFDSGLGGLFIAQAVRKAMPQYDYLYLGDTLNLPYGRRSNEQIYDLCTAAMRHLFEAGCQLVLMACNTASAACLRRLQQEFLINEFPDRRILGVVVPTLEAAIDSGHINIGLIATERTAYSSIYETELKKINPNVILHTQATPLLVPLIEHGGERYLDIILKDYIDPLIDKKIDCLILGCTHYVSLKHRLRALTSIDILSQDDIIPFKTENYLARHPEMEMILSRNGTLEIQATDLNEFFEANIQALMGAGVRAERANYRA
jgi:glutamate racemase